MLPPAVSSLLTAALVVGFSGSRAPSPASLAAVQLVAAQLVAAGTAPAIVVGDARGIDQRAAQLIPPACVFRAASFGSAHSARSAYAMRSIACVQAVAAGLTPGVWCAFPATGCTAGLRPARSSSACFNGSGSCTPVVFLPSGIVPPAAFGLVSAGQGWYVAAPSVGQLSFL